MQTPQHIIISRTDNIGDVVLTLPMAALIKQHWPSCKISFLARNYVADVINACPDVDDFISWDTLQKLPGKHASEHLSGADTLIHAFPRKQIAKLAKMAKIKNRIGTSHRLYHWLTCNRKVNFSRKKSDQHEAQLNLKLLAPLGLPTQASLVELINLTHLNKATTQPEAVQALLSDKKFNLVLHPLTNGNTKEWPLEKFAALINLLPSEKYNCIITGSVGELNRLEPWLATLPGVTNGVGKLTLAQFVNLLGQVNGVVVNSTGPLHIAAALGTPVLGLFPAEKGKDPGRWGPLGKHASFIEAQICSACRQLKGDCQCMQSITPKSVAKVVNTWLTL
jgi:ADP-heptose:LPS heptosyltransferase